MLSRFFGKRDKPAEVPGKDAKSARGLVVTEGDPDTAWKKWDKALAEQDAVRAAPPAKPAAAVAPAPSPQRPAFRAALPEPAQRAPAASALSAEDLDFVLPTAPMALEDMTLEQRKQMALETVELHHQRIANTIRTLWGYKECSVYINKLIMAGGDGMGHARVGFNQDAVEAMLALSDIHDVEFGPPSTMSGGLGLSL